MHFSRQLTLRSVTLKVEATCGFHSECKGKGWVSVCVHIAWVLMLLGDAALYIVGWSVVNGLFLIFGFWEVNHCFPSPSCGHNSPWWRMRGVGCRGTEGVSFIRDENKTCTIRQTDRENFTNWKSHEDMRPAAWARLSLIQRSDNNFQAVNYHLRATWIPFVLRHITHSRWRKDKLKV